VKADVLSIKLLHCEDHVRVTLEVFSHGDQDVRLGTFEIVGMLQRFVSVPHAGGFSTMVRGGQQGVLLQPLPIDREYVHVLPARSSCLISVRLFPGMRLWLSDSQSEVLPSSGQFSVHARLTGIGSLPAEEFVRVELTGKGNWTLSIGEHEAE
jgi:hypothetical protein